LWVGVADPCCAFLADEADVGAGVAWYRAAVSVSMVSTNIVRVAAIG
jgi:hypothetical protein